MKKDYVSPYVIKRLPRYYRFLGDLLEDNRDKISSRELGARLKLTPSQVRQDLNCFGEFGQQGYGYNIKKLRDEIGKILGIESTNNAMIIGAGNIGQAICDGVSFEKRGCKLVAVFDKNPDLVGKTVGGYVVQDVKKMPAFCRKHKPEIAVLCVPQESAKALCEELIELGITNFWNFTHFDINLYFDDVNVESVHLGDSLLTLVYNLNRARDKGDA